MSHSAFITAFISLRQWLRKHNIDTDKCLITIKLPPHVKADTMHSVLGRELFQDISSGPLFTRYSSVVGLSFEFKDGDAPHRCNCQYCQRV